MDPDQPAHPRSLIRIHAVRLQTLLQLEKPITNSMDPDQTARNALCWFCHDAAHISVVVPLSIPLSLKTAFFSHIDQCLLYGNILW
jgi:hypothetical protein